MCMAVPAFTWNTSFRNCAKSSTSTCIASANRARMRLPIRSRTICASANAALQTLGVDLGFADAVAGCDVAHSHTWYANLGGHLSGLLHDIPHVITAHSLEPRRPWKREQLGGGYAISSWVEDTAYHNAEAIIAVSAGDARGRAGLLPLRRPGAGARGAQRHRHRGLPQGRRGRCPGFARRRSGQALCAVRGPDHPAEGDCAPAAGGECVRRLGAAGAVCCVPRHPRTRRGGVGGDRRPAPPAAGCALAQWTPGSR